MLIFLVFLIEKLASSFFVWENEGFIPRRESAKVGPKWSPCEYFMLYPVRSMKGILEMSISASETKMPNCFIPRRESAKAGPEWGPFEYLMFYPVRSMKGT